MKIITWYWIFLIFNVAWANEKCYCGLRKDNYKLKCTSELDSENVLIDPGVECQILESLIKINTIYPDKVYELADNAFSGLKLDFDTKLQLSINTKGNVLDSRHFTNLNGVTSLRALESKVSISGCSLASIPTLKDITLDCQSEFVDNFITFGPSFSVLRLKNCRNLEKQFVCKRCTNRNDITVIQLLPGPKSTKDYIRFNRDTQPMKGFAKSLTTCHERICSDNDLCREDTAMREMYSDHFGMPQLDRRGDVYQNDASVSGSYFTKKVDIYWLWIASAIFALITTSVIIGVIIRKIFQINPNRKTHINKDMISAPEYA